MTRHIVVPIQRHFRLRLTLQHVFHGGTRGDDQLSSRQGTWSGRESLQTCKLDLVIREYMISDYLFVLTYQNGPYCDRGQHHNC